MGEDPTAPVGAGLADGSDWRVHVLLLLPLFRGSDAGAAMAVAMLWAGVGLGCGCEKPWLADACGLGSAQVVCC